MASFPGLTHDHRRRAPWSLIALAVALVSLVLAVTDRWVLAFGLLLALIGGASWKSHDSTPGAIAALIALPLLAFGLGWRPSLNPGSDATSSSAGSPVAAGPVTAPTPAPQVRESCTEGQAARRGRIRVERVYDRTCHGSRTGLVVDAETRLPLRGPRCTVGQITGEWETVFDSDCAR